MLLGILLSSVPARAQDPKSPKVPVLVALDPGHGGDEPGARGKKGLEEKDATLALAKALKEDLEAKGYGVLMVRSDDSFLAKEDRARVANEAKADLFVSLHFNAARARGAKGSEVFFLSLDQGDEDARMVAELENGSPAAAKSADPLAEILGDLAQKAFLEASQALAVEIQTQLNLLGGIKQRGVKQAPFAVLRRAAMPAALVEAAFLSNPKEEAKIKDPAFIKKLAEAISKGIRRYASSANGIIRRKAYPL